MSRRKRTTALKPSSSSGNTSVSILFSNLVIGSQDVTVDLESCIPFTKIRSLSSSGVRRLISSFLGSKPKDEPSDDDIYHTSGLALGTDIPMVVKLTGELEHFVYDHFRSQGLEGNDLEDRIESRKCWYGIVDGLHSHAALTFIKSSYKKWHNFEWYVKILNGGYSLEKYRQLARVQNARHHPHFYVELTLFDILYNLRLEHENLKREQKRCGGSETANAYDGVQHAKSSTLQQKANICIRLPLSVLEEIGKIMNLDRPDLKFKSRSKSKCGARTEDQLMESEDCRFFRRFININTLKGSSVFMNAKGEGAENIQINSLHRLKDLYLQNSGKAIKAEDLTSQFKLSTLAHLEDAKFLRFIESDNWPREMHDLRKNLLQTTLFDKDLEENSNNEFMVLPNLLDAYRRHFPHIATLKEAKWKASTEMEPSPEQPADDLVNEQGKLKEKINLDKEDNAQPIPPESTKEKAIEEIADGQKDSVSVLNDRGIFCYNMSWYDYLSNERTEESIRFDLLITRPPYAPSRSFIKSLRQSMPNEDIEKDEIEKLCKFMKRVMKSAGYIVLLLHFSMFKEWYEALDSHGFMIMPDEYVITYDPATVKRRKLIHFTQPAHDVALIAKLPGNHPDGFMPPFYQGKDDSKWGKFHSLLSNVPSLKSFLTKEGSKVPFDTREFNPDIFQDFITMFTPFGGSVIDPFSRTMTTGLACVRSNRSCHLIEKSNECFEAAISRLQKCIVPLPSFNSFQ